MHSSQSRPPNYPYRERDDLARDLDAGRISSNQRVGADPEEPEYYAESPSVAPPNYVRASGFERRRLANAKRSIARRVFGAVARFFFAVLLGVGATLAWQSCGDQARVVVGPGLPRWAGCYRSRRRRPRWRRQPSLIWWSSLSRYRSISSSCGGAWSKSLPTKISSLPSKSRWRRTWQHCRKSSRRSDRQSASRRASPRQLPDKACTKSATRCRGAVNEIAKDLRIWASPKRLACRLGPSSQHSGVTKECCHRSRGEHPSQIPTIIFKPQARGQNWRLSHCVSPFRPTLRRAVAFSD